MKKSKGSFLFSGLLGLMVFFLLLTVAIESSRAALHAMDSLYTQWELARAAGDFRARVETYLRYSVDSVVVGEDRAGSQLLCYGHKGSVRRKYYLSYSPTADCELLFMDSWHFHAKKGTNPLTPPHLAVKQLEIRELEPGKILWSMVLVHRRTGKEKQIREVFSYGTG